MDVLTETYKGDIEILKTLVLDSEKAASNAGSHCFEHMVTFVKQLIEAKKKESADQKKKYFSLKIEDRNQLSVAYKNVVGQRRAAWRHITSQEDSSGALDPQAYEELKEKYTKIIENELEEKCQDVLSLIQDTLLLPDKEIGTLKKEMTEEEKKGIADLEELREETVFYLKMCGDYYRYLAEFKTDNESIKEKATEKYDTALDVAAAGLAETHPTRLGLILNASVFRFEILKKPEQARKLAKEGFDSAIQKLDSLNDVSYKDSTLIMQLLRDNLTIWGGPNTETVRED